jgi:acetyltransferase-like isoleucine patch superfamily enzyme
MRRRGLRVEWGERVTGRDRLIVKGPGLVVIGDRCHFRDGPRTILHTVSPDAVIRLGAGSSLLGTVITSAAGVNIGAGALLGEAYISDSDYHSVQRNRRDPAVPGLSAPIEIGANVWLATGVKIMKGVTIGDHSVIGAHAVVRQSVPADVIVIGNPQQIVGQLDPDIEPYWP